MLPTILNTRICETLYLNIPCLKKFVNQKFSRKDDFNFLVFQMITNLFTCFSIKLKHLQLDVVLENHEIQSQMYLDLIPAAGH